MGNEFSIREQHDLLNSFASVKTNGVLLNAVSNRLLIRTFNNKSGRCISRTLTAGARQACKEGNMMNWWKTWSHEPNSLNIPTNHLTNLCQHHCYVYSIIASWLLGFSSAIESSHEAEPEWHRAHSDLNAWLGSHPSEMIFNESITLSWACSLISSLIAHNIILNRRGIGRQRPHSRTLGLWEVHKR